MADGKSDKPIEEEEFTIQEFQTSRRFSEYNSIRNKVTSELHKAKQQFFQSINPHNAKDFWRTVKCHTKNQHTILYLTEQDGNESITWQS